MWVQRDHFPSSSKKRKKAKKMADKLIDNTPISQENGKAQEVKDVAQALLPPNNLNSDHQSQNRMEGDKPLVPLPPNNLDQHASPSSKKDVAQTLIGNTNITTG